MKLVDASCLPLDLYLQRQAGQDHYTLPPSGYSWRDLTVLFYTAYKIILIV